MCTGIDNWLVIFAIVAACVFGLVVIILLIWLTCWCCYRCDAESAPTVVRRVVLRREVQVIQHCTFLVYICPHPKDNSLTQMCSTMILKTQNTV